MKSITIVGGGLAGLTLGIALRRLGVPVTIWEAGHYPRHRVCGEFISGRGQDVLQALGLHDVLIAAGARPANTALFFSGKRPLEAVKDDFLPVQRLPRPALCLSRFTIDALFARRFKELGGELHENRRWRETDFGEGVVRATGRRLQPVQNGWRWFGLKVHVTNVHLGADLEMHVVRNGYVGLCRLNGGEVNVCGLFRRPARAPDSPPPWKQLLRGNHTGSLSLRLAEAVFDESSFCSIAGLSLHPRRAVEPNECSIGDALTMIAPVSGNGMSLAFESAELAAGPLAAYSSGEISWPEARDNVAQQCDRRFARRLAWAGRLQSLMFIPAFYRALGMAAFHSQGLWRMLFDRTR